MKTLLFALLCVICYATTQSAGQAHLLDVEIPADDPYNCSCTLAAIGEEASASETPEELSESDKKTLRNGKISLLVLIFFATLGAELLPWALKRFEGAIEVLSIGACFSAGIILGAAFGHLLPDAAETWESYFDLAGPVGLRDADDVGYPFGQFIAVLVLLLLHVVDGLVVRRGIGEHSHGHGHSHAIPTLPKEAIEMEVLSTTTTETTKQHQRGSREQVAQAWIFFIALSVHSIFDGLSVGGESTVNGFYALLISVATHKLLDGFALGVPVYFANLSRKHTIFALTFSALMTPVGIGIGMAAAESYESSARGQLVKAFILSISAGSFIFISLVELLPAGLMDGKNLGIKYGATFVGWGIMSLIGLWV